MATIQRLIRATPAKRKGKAGFALEWSGTALSPNWLSNAALAELRSALMPDDQAVIDRAKKAGAKS